MSQNVKIKLLHEEIIKKRRLASSIRNDPTETDKMHKLSLDYISRMKKSRCFSSKSQSRNKLLPQNNT